MKKLISLAIVTVMLLASLCSCNGKAPSDNNGNIDNNDNNYNQNTNDISLSKGESFDLSEIVEAYKTSIKDGYMYKTMSSCGAFGLVDFDGDGILEVALASNSDFDNFALYVLRCKPGENKLISAGGYYIYKDSSVAWNAQAGTVYGQSTLKSWETNEFNELWRIENDGEENAIYYINNLPVSEEEIRYYLDNDCDEKIEWYEFTEANINKYITVEAFSDKSYFCNCPETKTDDTPLTEEQLSKLSEIVDTYKFVILNGKVDIHLPSCKGIALADVDQDGIAEIVLRYTDEFVILRYFEDYVYKYSLSWRSHLHKGGTCFWSTHAGRENGTSRIQFDEKNLVYVDETHVINHSTENAEYYINGVPATAEDILNVPVCNEGIAFCEFNKDNLDILITVDSLISKSLMCSCNNSINN